MYTVYTYWLRFAKNAYFISNVWLRSKSNQFRAHRRGAVLTRVEDFLMSEARRFCFHENDLQAQRGARAGPIRVRRDAFADHVIDIDDSKANVPQDHIRGVLNCGVKLWLQNTITPPGRLTHSRFRLKSLFSVVWLTRDLSGFCSA